MASTSFRFLVPLVLVSLQVFLPCPSLARDFKGISEPFRYSNISSTVAGRIAVIQHKEGDFVRKGEVILELEKDEEELEVARRKLISESKVELSAAEYKVGSLKRDYLATKQLFESTKSVSEEELWKIDLEYKHAISDFERLQMEEKREELEYKIAQVELAKRSIRAPFDGVVVKVNRKAGESCNALETICRLVDVRKCRFVTHIEAAASQGLEAGRKVTISIESGGAPATIEAVVEFVSPEVDPSSGLREIKAVFDNADGRVQPGITGKLSLAEAK